MAIDTYHPVTASGITPITLISGWQFAENAGTPAAATVLLRDGSAAGNVFAQIELAANESAGYTFANPVAMNSGAVYVEVAAGTVRGAVYGR